MTTTRLGRNGKRLSHIVVHNGIVYLTGQTATDRTQDVTGQTRQVLSRIDSLLSQAGTSRSHILLAQVFLKRPVADFAALNGVWEDWIPAEALPARVTVGAELAAADILVEIAIQAAIPSTD